jgi:hypothetical protein
MVQITVQIAVEIVLPVLLWHLGFLRYLALRSEHL